jgi:DNA-binding IclR family transcriptional regulator
VTGVSNLIDPGSWAPAVRAGGVEVNAATREFVAAKRRLGAGWDAIGRMLGCSGAAAREAFDTGYLKPPPPATPIEDAAAGLKEEPRRVLLALNGRDRTAGALAQACGLDRAQTGEALAGLRAARLAEVRPTKAWTLTRAGVEAVELVLLQMTVAAPARTVLEALDASRSLHGPRSLAAVLGWSPEAARVELAGLMRLGLIERRGGGTYALTRAGRGVANPAAAQAAEAALGGATAPVFESRWGRAWLCDADAARRKPKARADWNGTVAGATHEVMVIALDAEKPREPSISKGRAAAFLTPLNFVGQFIADNDAAAMERVEADVRDIVEGLLNPDTDSRAAWIARYGSACMRP